MHPTVLADSSAYKQYQHDMTAKIMGCIRQHASKRYPVCQLKYFYTAVSSSSHLQTCHVGMCVCACRARWWLSGFVG